MPKNKCLACGGLSSEERVHPLEVLHNGKSATINDRHMFCERCGDVSYHGSQISEHELAVAAAIRQMDGLLTAEELLHIRTKYKFKQTDMEQMLSTGPKTWTRWERGKIPQNKAADTLIRLIAEDPEVARRLMVQSGIENAEASATFDEIERNTHVLARARLKSELRTLLSGDLEHFAEQAADRAINTINDMRRQAADRAVAA